MTWAVGLTSGVFGVVTFIAVGLIAMLVAAGAAETHELLNAYAATWWAGIVLAPELLPQQLTTARPGPAEQELTIRALEQVIPKAWQQGAAQ